MSSENEEQKPVAQTLCGALQKEANCKCLVLSVLIYGCLAAVTWCRCANVTKIVINFSTFPIKSTKHVSPCDDGYIYIPVAFMGMLYLVYLVECYHSPIRIDLLHAEGQSVVLAKLTQMRLAQPSIWWKAISYHYVRRKRQVMRYRNGDNFTTTQVYYERVNSHAATSFYFYDYCGSKDISKELVLDPKIPITKISLSKGFAFSNVRSATEFEEARSRFFAEQEFRDDYMEMREGLDLGCNLSPMTLVAVLGNPWFTRSYVYWCLSALLLSWPLRIIIECNTQYVDYQVTKLFGVNYDTPTNVQIHTSASQLSAPGSYMLAPSYSEALLMEPSGPRATTASAGATPMADRDLVPSYSEALLYERAAPELQPPKYQAAACECPCHGLREFVSQDSVWRGSGVSVAMGGVDEATVEQTSPADGRICDNCLSDGRRDRSSTATTPLSSSCRELASESSGQPKPPLDRRRIIAREYSEPDLRRSAELLSDVAVLRNNGRSLENIMENEEAETSHPAPARNNTGAIPKRGHQQQPVEVTLNPLAEAEEHQEQEQQQQQQLQRLPNSRSAYFCLRSILKQNRRRFTLVTPEELQSLTRGEGSEQQQQQPPEACTCDGCAADAAAACRPDTLRIDKRLRPVSCQSLGSSRNSSRTLIFASPIQTVCPLDPFGGREVVRSDNPPGYEEAMNLPPVLNRLRRSIAEREATAAAVTASTSSTTPSTNGRPWSKQRRTADTQNLPAQSSSTAGPSRLLSSTQSGSSETAISLPSYDGLTVPPDSRNQGAGSDESSPFLGHDELAAAAASSPSASDATAGTSETSVVKTRSRLTRSLTERRITLSARRQDQALRKSFTERIDTGLRIPGIKRMNINIETSL